MSFEVEGLDNISSTLEALGNVGKKVGKKSVRNGLNVILDSMKKGAPVDKQHSRDKLLIDHVRANNHGSAWGACGIGSKNWTTTKQLWYQNYGYENHGLNFTGQRVESNVGWIDKVYNKSKNKAEREMINTLGNELDKVLK